MGSDPLPLMTVFKAFMFTDLVGSTDLKRRLGDAAGADAISRHDALFRKCLTQFGGREEDDTGDGFLAAFDVPSDAVRCALSFQEGLSKLTTPEPLRVRIGIHSGEIVHLSKSETGEGKGEDKLVGLALDTASRVMGLAQGGQILLTLGAFDSARQQVSSAPDGSELQWLAHGAYLFQGRDDPLEVFEVGVEGLSHLAPPPDSDKAKRGGGLSARAKVAGTIVVLAVVAAIAYALTRPEAVRGPAGTPDLQAITSLVVLPFDNYMGDPEQEYFVDGMTDALSAELGKIRALRVISRSSAMRYKGTEKTHSEIAAELGVEAVVEGSVFRAGDEVRITVQLIHVATDSHLLSENYPGTLANIFELQGEVAMAIADAIRVAVTPEEETRIVTAKPVNKEAYEAYLRGRFFFWKFTPDGFGKAVESFQRALELDPGFAQAHAWLGLAYWVPSGYGFVPPTEAVAQARPALDRALTLDDTLADAHGAAGWIALSFDWDWTRAEREFLRAIELNPGDPVGHNGLAQHYHCLGRFDDAIRTQQKAVDLDPLNLFYSVSLAEVYASAGRLEEARAQRRKVLEMDPVYVSALRAMAQDYILVSRYDEAIELIERGMAVHGRLPNLLGRLVWALAAAERKAEAVAVLGELHAKDRNQYVQATMFALAYAALGDMNEAFRWIDQALEDRNILLSMPYWSGWISLRGDPRFLDMLRRINYPAIEQFKARFQPSAATSPETAQNPVD